MSKPRSKREVVLSPEMILGTEHAKALEKKLLFGPNGEVVSGTQFVWTEDFVLKPK